MIPRLKELYSKQIRPELKEKFSFKNSFMSPQIEKVVLNMGLGVDGNDNKTNSHDYSGNQIKTNLTL